MNFQAHLHRLRVFLLLIIAVMPFFLVGIVASMVLSLNLLGIGPHDKSWAAVLLFTAIVPFGILIGGMLGYGLLLSILRLASCEHWLDTLDTAPPPSRLNAPYLWVKKIVYRLIPR